MKPVINVIGAGLAGCEAALQISSRNISVKLFDMKPTEMSPAHHSNNLSELVCSNSLKAISENNASGILKKEMELFCSVVIEAAYKNKVEAGGALAVDRDEFSKFITKKINDDNNIEFISKKIDEIPEDNLTIIATGPLTGGKLYEDILKKTGSNNLFFYDAAAPVVYSEAIDMNKVYKASRYDKGGNDYINCPLNESEYRKFIEHLLSAETVVPKGFEKGNIFEGCMPVEVMAARGYDTLRFGPLKPVGLIDPKTGKRPFAVVQLRAENKEKSLYNLVGFQTNLKFGEQKKLIELIPGLESASIARHGVMHRNSYINSPALLETSLRFRMDKNLYFAGQITGVEGYLESAVTGILAGLYASAHVLEIDLPNINDKTITGALVNHITDKTISKLQPMNSNFGLLRGSEEHIRDKKERREYLAQRAYSEISKYIRDVNEAFCS